MRKEYPYIIFTGAKSHRQQLNESKTMNTLNKAQQRDIAKIIVNSATLGDDYLARGLSALYRSALKTSQQNTILGLAIIYKVASNPEFITGRRA
jgi:hypothetical protein